MPAVLAGLEEASKIYDPRTSLLSHPSMELHPSIVGGVESDYESDSDDGRFFNRGKFSLTHIVPCEGTYNFLRDLTRPDHDYGNNIEVAPMPSAQLIYSEETTDSPSHKEAAARNLEAGSVSLDISSGIQEMDSSSQWGSSFNDADWDVDSSAAF